MLTRGQGRLYNFVRDAVYGTWGFLSVKKLAFKSLPTVEVKGRILFRSGPLHSYMLKITLSLVTFSGHFIFFHFPPKPHFKEVRRKFLIICLYV